MRQESASCCAQPGCHNHHACMCVCLYIPQGGVGVGTTTMQHSLRLWDTRLHGRAVRHSDGCGSCGCSYLKECWEEISATSFLSMCFYYCFCFFLQQKTRDSGNFWVRTGDACTANGAGKRNPRGREVSKTIVWMACYSLVWTGFS